MEEVVRLPGVKITGLRPLNYTFYSTTISDILRLEERQQTDRHPLFAFFGTESRFEKKPNRVNG